MNRLPDHQQPTAHPAGQPTINDAATQFLADLESAYTHHTDTTPTTPTHYRDETPVPPIGTTPPVPQPGRTPMSQHATDASALILSTGAASIPIGGMTSLVIYTLGHTDPTALAIAAAAPLSITVPILALCRLAGRAKAVVESAPPTVHQTYTGTVHQTATTINATNRGIWATTHNQLPPSE